jgi:hypothetical protein
LSLLDKKILARGGRLFIWNHSFMALPLPITIAAGRYTEKLARSVKQPLLPMSETAEWLTLSIIGPLKMPGEITT